MRSVGFKYFITFILCAAFVLTLVFLFGDDALEKYSEQKRLQSLENICDAVSDYVNERKDAFGADSFSALIAEDGTNVRLTLEALSHAGDNVFILLCDSEGKVVAYVDAPSGFNENTGASLPHTLADELSSSKSVSTVLDKGISGLTSSATDVVAVTVTNSDSSALGHVAVCATKGAPDRFFSEMSQKLLLALICFFAVGVLLYYLITYRTSRDLKAISECAGRFAEGDFSPRLKLKRDDEISDLAETFNNMADSLKKYDDSRNNFIASVSHDLRTPMTTIKGLIECVIAGVIPQSEVNTTLTNVTEEINRLNRLVSAMLDVTRIQSGKRQFNIKEFDICELIRLVMISLEPEGAKKELEAELDIEEDLLPVMGDKDSIHQVLYNIVQNAVKFSNHGGLIKISVRDETREEIREREDSFDLVPKRIVSVYNEGVGISKELKTFVFDRFFKADSTRQMDKQGVGLGMFIAKTILDAHGQKIYVESEEGKWCRFSFTLDKPAESVSPEREADENAAE